MKYDFTCPFCNHTFPLISDTYKDYIASFKSSDASRWPSIPEDSIHTNFYACPHCNKISVKINGHPTGYYKDINVPIYPNSLAKQFPKYIPSFIRNDYEEAYAILNLSPKASATLSRRCLQGMIRDFWKISKRRLIDEIDALKSLVPISQWNAIDSLRKIGNIGAHMEKDVNVIVDVEPDEAQKLLKLIELLIDKWYISRHDEEQLLQEIQSISDEKQNQRDAESTASSNVS